MDEKQVISEDTQVGFLAEEYGRPVFTATPISDTVINDAKKGDEDAFEQLFMGTYRYVFAAVRKYLKNDQDAYDAIQETYTRVYKGISRLESTDSFYPWLHRIAENCAKDVLSKSGYDLTMMPQEPVEDDKAPFSDVAADVTDVLKQLPPEQAELLIRVYYDDMHLIDISRMYNIPRSTVHNRLKAAKKNLKQLLKVRGIDRPIYGGDLVAMISTAIRNAIGTQLLSMAVAEEILHSVMHSKNKKGAVVISRFARKARSKAALKIASIILLTVVGFSAVTTAAVLGAYNLFGDYGNTVLFTETSSSESSTSHTSSSPSKPSSSFDNSYEEGSSQANPSPNNPSSDKNSASNTSSGDTSANPSDTEDSSGSDSTPNSPTTPSSPTPSNPNQTESTPEVNETPSQTPTKPDDSEQDFLSGFAGGTLTSPGFTEVGTFELNAAYATGVNQPLSNSRVCIHNDWIYYCSFGQGNMSGYNFYKIKTDGTQKTLIIKNIYRGEPFGMTVHNNRLYIVCMDLIYSAKLDGSDLRIEGDRINNTSWWYGDLAGLVFEGDYIYSRSFIINTKLNLAMKSPISILAVRDGKFYGNKDGNFVSYNIATKTTTILKSGATYEDAEVLDTHIILSNSGGIDAYYFEYDTVLPVSSASTRFLFATDVGGEEYVYYHLVTPSGIEKMAVLNFTANKTNLVDFDCYSKAFCTDKSGKYIYVYSYENMSEEATMVRYNLDMTNPKKIF